MVFDSIKNYKLYTNLSPRIAKSLKIMAETDFNKIENGKYPVVPLLKIAFFIVTARNNANCFFV